MLESFENHFHQHFFFLKEKKLLLATSGGIDSMVMLHLFQKLKCTIAIAHCNFQLRGIESFEDEKFVVANAESNGIPVFTTKFDTKSFAEDYKLSTQVAARELRYHWFYELLETENYDYILTAHHADDNLETFLINLSRGTGLDGLTGIPQQNNQVVRPLLAFGRADIESYANANKILWREDSSNASDQYLRNKIRHDVVPVLKDIQPDFISAFEKTQSYLQESQQMVEDASTLIYQQVANEVENEIQFDLKKLRQLPNYRSYLYYWLKEYGFYDWSAVYDLAESQSGKRVFSKSFTLLKDRTHLILQPNKNELASEFLIDNGQHDVKVPLIIKLCKVADISSSSNSSIFVDENTLTFPLQIRRYQVGDRFHPYGMNGQSKKLSKFFKDEKLSLFEKEAVWVLCSNNQIVWVIGIRADERFKVQDSTKNIIKISIHQ